MLPPQLPPDDLLALGQYILYGRHDPVERGRAHGHHDRDGFLGDEVPRPDPVWMALRKGSAVRPLTVLLTRIGSVFSGRAARRDVASTPER